MQNDKPRWQYRFENFKKAYILLKEAAKNINSLNQLEQEGLIQRFEYCTELSWKTIKDYLENQNVIFPQITPRAVLKEAIAINFLNNAQMWLDMLDTRNQMSQAKCMYDFANFKIAAQKIANDYITCFDELYEKLSQL